MFEDIFTNEQSKKIEQIVDCNAKTVNNEIKIDFKRQLIVEYNLSDNGRIINTVDSHKYNLCEGEVLTMGNSCDI